MYAEHGGNLPTRSEDQEISDRARPQTAFAIGVDLPHLTSVSPACTEVGTTGGAHTGRPGAGACFVNTNPAVEATCVFEL